MAEEEEQQQYEDKKKRIKSREWAKTLFTHLLLIPD